MKNGNKTKKITVNYYRHFLVSLPACVSLAPLVNSFETLFCKPVKKSTEYLKSGL